LQNNYSLEINAFYSRDKDEIFLKCRATEENLKIQADLTDYRLQFKTRAKPSKFDFKNIAPYAPFEKDKEGGNFGGIFATGKEQYFKTYDGNDNEVESGETMFRYVDRCRLVASIINEGVDLSEL